jgi:hypothetical protein
MKNIVFTILLAIFLILPFSSCAPKETPTANEPILPETQSPNVTKPPPPIPSPPDPLTDMVIKADLIVLGTITDKKYEIVTVSPTDNASQEAKAGEPKSGSTSTENITLGKFTYTIFTLSVEKVIKGDPTTKQVFIKTIGGEEVGSYFLFKDRILALLNRLDDNIYTVPRYGIMWFESPTARAESVVKLQDAIGRILKIMTVNNIPIALPPSEWPPLPATGPVSPQKN